MSLVETYLENNGYDCDGNTAEDTLVFFVRDEEMPTTEETEGKSNKTITNASGNTVNGISAEAAAMNTETHAEAYKENGKDTSTTFSIARGNAPADNEYSDTPVAGSLNNTDSDADDVSDLVPKMAEMDSKQTDTEHSTDKGFKA